MGCAQSLYRHVRSVYKCAWGHFVLLFIHRLHQMSKHVTTTNMGILSTPNKPQIYENISMSLYDSLVVTKLVYHKAYMQRANGYCTLLTLTCT